MQNYKKKVIIFGINSMIGKNIANFLVKDGAEVFGTYRNKNSEINKLDKNIKILKCDLTKINDLKKLRKKLLSLKFKWDLIFFSVGTTKPIGPFFSTSFQDWAKSFNTNFLCQISALHQIFNIKKNENSSICFLAGTGTNGTMDSYSAYTISKIALIKFCELISSEYPKLKIFIIGPGLTRTRSHLETLQAKKKAGKNYLKIKKFWKSKKQGTPFKKIYDCLNWAWSEKKNIISGRNFSVVFDKWGNKNLSKLLLQNKDYYKLRRLGNNIKIKK